jgi:hypothetical protein
MLGYGDYQRWLYRDGRPNRVARLRDRASVELLKAGITPPRTAVLSVQGRRTGLIVSLPVIVTAYEGERYLVSMLGETNWVRNVRAADGRAVLRQGSIEAVRLTEVPAGERAPVLRRYLAVAPGARAHIPVSHRAPVAEFEPVAASVPVFQIGAAVSPAADEPDLWREPVFWS